MTVSVAVLPGSYDPMTTGHLDLVRRALAQYDRVVVAVMNNDQKVYRFTMDERVHMAALTLAGLDRVTLVHSEGLLVDLFELVGGACAVALLLGELDVGVVDMVVKPCLVHLLAFGLGFHG